MKLLFFQLCARWVDHYTNPGATWREIMTQPNFKMAAADTANCDASRRMETSGDRGLD